MVELIDSHIHLDDERYWDQGKSGFLQLLDEAKAVGIAGWILPATTRERFAKVDRLTSEHSEIYGAYGLHPYFMADHQEADLSILESYLREKNPVALGECGLDFMIDDPDKEGQMKLFRAQLRLAKRYDLPLILHSRKSLDLLLREVRRYGPFKGVIHSFSGSLQQAKRAIELGFYLGFGGAATYPRAKRLHKIIQQIPLNRLLLETDGPDQPSAALERGVLHLPKHLPLIAKSISQIRGIEYEALLQIHRQNIENLFSLEGRA